MRNRREPARSPTDPLVIPPSLVITPTPVVSVMSVLGLAQFGWLKKLVAVISHLSLACSPNRNSLARPALKTLMPGPLITPLPEVPNWPGCGEANAVGSNQRLSVCCEPDRLAFLSASGRKVTDAGVLESVNVIPTGSSPVQNGVRNIPVWAV